MKSWLKANSNKINAWVIGLGMILFVIHNPWLVQRGTSSGEPIHTDIFLPVIGMILILFGCMNALLPKWGEKKKLGFGIYWQKPIWDIDLGNKWVYIPLLVIVASIAVSGFMNGATLGDRVAPMFFGILLFGVYLASRKLGKEIFFPFAVCVVIEAISCAIYGVMNPGDRAGGLIAWTSSNYTGGNYALAVRFLVFGSVVSIFRRQWIVVCIALVGLFFTGCEEAILAVGVLGLAVLIRKDWSKRLLIPVGILVVAVAVAVPTGIVSKYIRPTEGYISALSELPQAETWVERNVILDKATNNRWSNYVNVVKNIQPFGHGYNITNFYVGIPHDVPLIIIDQVGILACLAWLFVMFYCLKKYRWRYAFIAVLALSLFDHAIWTQCAPWIWGLIGVASSSEIKSDYIFKNS